MTKKQLQIFLPAIIMGIGTLLALTASSFATFPDQGLISAAFSTGLGLKPDPGLAGLYQAATPTPIGQAVSHPGSTDGIVWLGFVIVAIVLLPILLRRIFWTK